jgi:hypothetical protein
VIREESIRLRFRFAAGRAGGRYLAALRDEGALTGSRCPDCARTLAPARSFCPVCGGDDLASVALGPGGVVTAWTQVAGKGVFALVKPDGADTAMLHRIVGPDAGLAFGARVRMVLAPERRGEGRDLMGFELVGEDRP